MYQHELLKPHPTQGSQNACELMWLLPLPATINRLWYLQLYTLYLTLYTLPKIKPRITRGL